MNYITHINEFNSYYSVINSEDEILSKFFSDLYKDKFSKLEVRKVEEIIGTVELDEEDTILRCCNSIYESDNYSIYIDIFKMSDEWFIVNKYFEDNDITSPNQSPTIEEVIKYKCDQIEGLIRCLKDISIN